MDGTLVELLPATESADLSELVRLLCREVLELRQEVNELRRENAELRQQAGYWKTMHARAVHRAEQLEADGEQLRGESRKLQNQLFGRKSEKTASPDRSNHLEGETEPAPSSPPKRGQRRDRPGPCLAAQAGPKEGSARPAATGLQPLARRRGPSGVTRRPAHLPAMWSGA